MAALLPVSTPHAEASGSHPASVALTWRVQAPRAASADAKALEASLIAVGRVKPLIDAAQRDRVAIAIAADPVFIASLSSAAAGRSSLTTLSEKHPIANTALEDDALAVLAIPIALDPSLANSSGGRRFASESLTIRSRLTANRPGALSRSEIEDFAGLGALLTLLASGFDRQQAALLGKPILNAADVKAIADALGIAADAVQTQLRQTAHSGYVELAALPAYEPILPLVIDAAGQTRQSPFMIDLKARADAAASVKQGLDGIRMFSATGSSGVFSPHGAYDDETAALLQEQHVAYAVFSDRVVASTTGASAEAVRAAAAAAFHAYALDTGVAAKLPILFSSDAQSATLDALPATLPTRAFGDRVVDMARGALAVDAGSDATLLLLSLDVQSPLLQRADRDAMLHHLDEELTSGRDLRAVTPGEFLRTHSNRSETYGYAAASDAGGFALWMGTSDQASMWNALDAARKAAGGDNAVAREPVRDELLRAEGNRWFASLALPQPRASRLGEVVRFRAAIAAIYRAAGTSPPSDIAPVKLEQTAAAGSNP